MSGIRGIVMNKFVASGLFLLAVVLACSAAADAKDVCDKMQDAIFQEEMQGDLEAAVKLFQEIVDEKPAEKRYGAEAIYRMARCYWKLGKNDLATEKFNLLIKNYPDQEAYLKKAKTALKEMPLSAPIKLGPVPWGDTEVLTYDLMSTAGSKLGEIVYTLVKNERRGG